MNKKTIMHNILSLSVVTIIGLFLTFSSYSQSSANLAYTAKMDHSGGGVSAYGFGPEIYNDSVICAGATSCFGWVTTNSNPDPNAWIEINWGNSYKKFDQITIFVNDYTDRALSGATIQTWNGTSFVNYYTYNLTSLSTYSYTINFPVLISNRIRLTNLSYFGGGNPATEEIEVRYSKLYLKDAGMSAFNAPAAHITPGSNNVLATIMNYGKDTLRSAGMRWSVDGTVQTSPANWTGTLANLRTDRNKLLGSYNFTAGIRNLKAWTVNPNGLLDSNAYNDTIKTSIYVCNPITGTYIVDAAGTGDFKTFNEALNWVTACGMSGPVKIRVKPGYYTEQITISTIPGISKTNTLTFESFTLDSTSVNLNYSATSDVTNWVVMLTGAKHITFKNITIQATSSSYGCAVNIADIADSNSFLNNIIQTSTQNSTYFSGILFSSWVNGNTQDEYNIIRNNVIIGGYLGIWMFGVDNITLSKGNVIDHNLIKDFYYYGLYLVYQDSLKVTGNTLINSSTSSGSYGIMPYYSNNTEISKNNIKLYASSTVIGIYNNYANDAATNALSKVYNNFISLGTSSNSSSYGIYNSYSGYVDIYDNTINIYSSSTNSYGMYFQNGTAASYNLKNNIVANNSSGYAIYMNTGGLLNSSDYNDLYTNGANLIYNGGNVSNLSAWQSASSKDMNSISSFVQFYSNKDLHVNTSVVANLGVSISGLTTDFDGESRTTTPDIGADEFTLVANDAGVSDINNPLSPCPGSNAVSVKVKNYGTTTLSAITVNWSVNGVTQSPATVTTLSLTQYQEAVVNLGSFVFNTGFVYKLKFWTTLPNSTTDLNTRNDLFDYTISKTALNGTYTIGATLSDYRSFTEAVKDLVQRGVCSSVLFRVKPGTYNENVNIPPILGSSATNTITFESFNNDSSSVDLNYSATGTADNFVVGIFGADYITFRKLKIRALGTNYGRAIYFTGGAEYCTFSNNIISTQLASASSYFAGIYSDATLDNYPVIKNNKITGGYYGIYLSGQNSSAKELNAYITGNSVTGFYYYGIYSYYLTSPTISNNYIESAPNISSAMYGIYCYYNYDSLKVTKNKVFLNGTSTNYGINMYYCQSTTALNGLVANNFIGISGASTTTNYGLYDYYSNYLNIYHNNVLTTTNSGTNGYAFYCYYGTGMKVVNNIFSNQGGGYAYYLVSTSSITTSNYNDLYSSGPTLGYWNGNCTSLAAWKTNASATSNEQNSINANPYYYTNTDLHVYSSYLNASASATILSIVKDDIDNQLRNTSSPDIGADEFTPITIDAAIITLVSPTSACPGSSNPVSVRLRNYGLTNITSTKIKWKINGTQKATISYIGNLAPMKDTVIQLGYETFFKNVNYVIKAWTDTVNGVVSQNRTNDSLILLNFHTALSGSYTIGASGRDYPNFSAAVADISTNGICDSVVFVVDPGTYIEHVSIPPIVGSSAAHSITFKSANGDSSSVIMSYGATGSSDNYVVQLLGADYIRFEKITLRATSTSGYGCIVDLRNAANYNIFRHNMFIYTGPASGSAYGVLSNSGSVCSYNLIDNNNIQNGYYAIYFYGNSTTVQGKGNKIRNNIISNFYYYGMMMYYQDSLELFNNKLTGGVYAAYGAYCYYVSNANVSSNQVYLNSSNSMYGMYFYSCTGTSAAYFMVTNNMISISGTSTTTVYGIYVGYCNYNKYYHNSIQVACGSSTAGGSMFFSSPATGTTYGNIDVQNNIIVNTGGGYAMNVDAGAATILPRYLTRSNFNDLFVTGANIGHFNTTDLPQINNWRALNVNFDPKSINVMPSFVSATNLHLANYAGMVVSITTPLNVPKDIDGETRSALKPVVGADENPHLPIDAGIRGILSPSKVACDGIMPVSANLYNFGLTKLDSVYVDYFINGVLQRTIQFKGSLTYLGYSTILFGVDTFTAGSPVKIKIKTRLPNGSNNDTYTYNDADSVDVRFIAFPVISSVVGDTVCTSDSATLKVISPNSQIFTWYDSLTNGNILGIDSIFKTGPLTSSTTYYVDACTGGNPASISTTNATIAAPDMGYMFDVKATNSDVTIDSFAIHLTSASLGQLVPVEVYYRVGSYIGKETSAASWTLLGADTVVSNGYTSFTDISVGGIKIKKNQIFGFYVTTTDPNYVMHNTTGAKSFSDANILITTGTKTFYPFDVTYVANSTWNGTVYYGTGSMCRSARYPVVATVNTVPKIKLGNDTAFCKGGSLLLNAGSGNYTYSWKYGSSTKTISTNQSITVDSGGSYRVIVTNTCGNVGTDTLKLTIRPLPDAIFTVNNANQCLGGNSFVFTNHSTLSSGKFGGFLWKFGDGQTKTDSNTFHSYSTVNSYLVKLKTTSQYGCIDSASTTVNINPQPTILFSIDNSAQCLRGNLFSFANNSTVSSGTISSQKWNFGDAGTSTLKTPTHTFLTDGTFDVKLISTTNKGCSDSLTKTVTLYPMPLTGFSINDSSQCFIGHHFVFTNTSKIKTGTLTYGWNMGDATLLNTIDAAHDYASPASYKVKLRSISNFGCLDSIIRTIYVKANPTINLGKDTTIKSNQSLTLNAGSGLDSIRWSNGATSITFTIDSANFGGLGVKNIHVDVYKNGCTASDSIVVTIKTSVGINIVDGKFNLSVYPNPVNELLQIKISGITEKANISLTDMLGNEIWSDIITSKNVSISQVDMSRFSKGTYLLKLISNGTIKVVKVVKN